MSEALNSATGAGPVSAARLTRRLGAGASPGATWASRPASRTRIAGWLGVVAAAAWGVHCGPASAAPQPRPEMPELRGPVRIAAASRREWLVSDHGQGLVLKVDAATLAVAEGFAVQGRPVGVAQVGKGGKTRIFVGNEATKRVEVYDRKGQWKYNLGAADDYVWHPTDIAVDEGRGYVLVVDGRQKVVRVFSEAGLALFTIPAAGPDPALLAHPTGLAVDAARQEVLVSDYGDPLTSTPPRIQIFAYDGTLLRTISGKQGMLGQRFSRPQGLAVDSQGHVFVVDCVSGEVLVFDGLTGAGVKTLGAYGTEPGELQFPLDLVIDPVSKDLFVTNNENGRIEVFTEGAVLP